MIFTRGLRKLHLLAAFVTILLATPGIGQDREPEFRDWAGENGKTLNAKVVGFDPVENKIKWQLRGGGTAYSKLSSLTQESRVNLWEEPVIEKYVRDNIEEHYDVRLVPMGGAFVSILIVLAILAVIFVCDFFAFKIAVQALAGSDRDVVAFIKHKSAFLFLFPLSCLALLFLFNGGNQVAAGLGLMVIGLLQTIAYYWILMSHYGIGFWRTTGLSMIHGVVLQIAVTIGYFAVFVIIAIFAATLDSPLGPLVDDWIYRPMGML